MSLKNVLSEEMFKFSLEIADNLKCFETKFIQETALFHFYFNIRIYGFIDSAFCKILVSRRFKFYLDANLLFLLLYFDSDLKGESKCSKEEFDAESSYRIDI